MLDIVAMNSSNPAHLLHQIAQIQRMERGKLSIMREGPEATHYKHQVWEDGKNVSRHVSSDQAQAVQAAIEGYRQFEELTAEYAQLVIERTRAELAASSKKKRYAPRLLSSSPKTRRLRKS
jgi:quinol monooxygenase YgiN